MTYREVFINCNRYRIIDKKEDTVSGQLNPRLDRTCNELKDYAWTWSTGAVFVGAPWRFQLPTRLIWLAKEKRCLPCFPIGCTP